MFWGHVQGCGAGQRAAGRRRFVLVRLLAGLAGGSLVLAGVAGCDGAEADPDPGPVEPPVVGSTTEDGANAGDDDSGVDEDDGASGPQEYEHPVPGPDFDDDGQAGAEAAAVYFVELYSYLYATGDFEAWDELTTDECNFCSGVRERVDAIYTGDGYAITGVPTITSQSSHLWTDEPGDFAIDLQVEAAEVEVYTATHARQESHPSGPVRIAVLVEARDGEWKIVGADAEDAD